MTTFAGSSSKSCMHDYSATLDDCTSNGKGRAHTIQEAKPETTCYHLEKEDSSDHGCHKLQLVELSSANDRSLGAFEVWDDRVEQNTTHSTYWHRCCLALTCNAFLWIIVHAAITLLMPLELDCSLLT